MTRPDGGRVVPVYAVTKGRTRSGGRDLPVESLVTATDLRGALELQSEYRAIMALAVRPVSLVEIGAALRVPVGVARVLVSDLADSGYLTVHAPPPTSANGAPAPALLNRLLEGLRAR
ncbi:hypothetical protein BJF78_20995 [Pseudonocardia sp. CNS-139]|nr:hypothetical protein BJF78_20995 [Pseudonocardia sp. CNS-139]